MLVGVQNAIFWQYLMPFSIQFINSSSRILPGSYTSNNQIYTGSRLFITALFITEKYWHPCECPGRGDGCVN